MSAVVALDQATSAAVAELLLTIADDEFVIGYWDSEWTGIAPMLEEDVAMSSLAQDEIGHARVLYELLADLTGDDADRIAYGRPASDFRHARLLDHPRTDWAFSVGRRYLYDTADAVRLEALADSSYQPLADVVAKIRREERYHLMHVDHWLRRLCSGGPESRRRVEAALEALGPDAGTVFTPLETERALLQAGVVVSSTEEQESAWRASLATVFAELGLPPLPPTRDPEQGRARRSADFEWLWSEFTSVARSEAGAVW
jgi:ring-1,2-phenylacetyl-CoA epoxidase subunit PaaC